MACWAWGAQGGSLLAAGTWPILVRNRSAGDTCGETDVLRWRYVVIRKAWLLLIPAVGGLLIAA